MIASYWPRRHSSATGAPDLARQPTSGPASSRHQPPSSRTARVRIRAWAAMRSTGSVRSSVARPRGGSGRVIPAASATRRHTACTASSVLSSDGRRSRRCPPMEAISAWSARVRTASPARMPAAVRSAWARSMVSIQRSTAVPRRYC
ncbi:hypothetical protein SANTM175S_10281 [Streptomyces antimycoticus]